MFTYIRSIIMATTSREEQLIQEARARTQVLQNFGFISQDLCAHMLCEPFIRIVFPRIIYFIHKYGSDPGIVVRHLQTDGLCEMLLREGGACQRDMFTCLLQAVITILDFLESPLPAEECDEFDSINSSDEEYSDGI